MASQVQLSLHERAGPSTNTSHSRKKQQQLNHRNTFNVNESDDEDEEEVVQEIPPKQRPTTKIRRAVAVSKTKITVAANELQTLPVSSKAIIPKEGLTKGVGPTPKKSTRMPEANSGKSLNTKDMIIQAVADMKDKKGSTIFSIKKYIMENYEVSQQRKAKISKLLKTANEQGWLVQTAGTGASSGSHFKLPSEMKKDLSKMKKKRLSLTTNKIAHKAKPKEMGKEPTKRKIVKKSTDKEVPAKKKKTAVEEKVLKKPVAVAKKKMV